MKSTGITRRIDPLGRIVLPKELRRTLDIQEGTPMEIFTEGEQIIIRKYSPACVFCGQASNVQEYLGKKICISCLRSLKASR